MERPTKEEIQQLPLYTGLKMNAITIVENISEAEQALRVLSEERCLGFDTESKPIFRKGQTSPGPTLIQLSTISNAFIFPTRFTEALSVAGNVLSNPAIKKVGFGLRGDNKELREKLNINIKNTEDLSVILKNLIGDKNNIGARTAVAMVLKQRLGKGAQKSNWGNYPLMRNQILYAANDAHCAICIEHQLKSINIMDAR